MEERELLSITEENAILVTVQFVDAGFRTKTSRAEVESYDIELIVKNDIRCDQLIDAVQYGLEKKLNVYQVDLESLKSAHYSRDSRRPGGCRRAAHREGAQRKGRLHPVLANLPGLHPRLPGGEGRL